MNLTKNSEITLRAPVPLKVYAETTRPLWTSGWFNTKSTPLAALLNESFPSIDPYSISSLGSFANAI